MKKQAAFRLANGVMRFLYHRFMRLFCFAESANFFIKDLGAKKIDQVVTVSLFEATDVTLCNNVAVCIEASKQNPRN